ncbi:MAG TPA: hypothetical protein VGN82_17180 [Bosea sp. (in: a-proteobacteria)]|jgi:hypothetical protein|uniref:hypothetical protein n=1 Tax=Bosea sp. (in: a-proteobacteria) TaxID=1871050 RepID=UPI002E15F767|nr:hypothetical protein [Bosea sp. (in: a-proteobacteria)]
MMLRKLALMAALGAALVSATSASAQIYGDPFGPMRPGYRPPPPPEYQPRPPRYQEPYDRGYDRGYDRRRGYYDDGPRRGRGRAMCVTSRGACPAPPIQPGSPCRCDIDGLTKRGIVQ